MNVYLFGMVRSNAAHELRQLVNSIETSRDLGKPRLLSAGPVSLVFSEVLAEEIRPNRRNLLAHMRVLEAANQETDVLPVQFGQVFADEGMLLTRIEPRLSAIEAELDRLAGQTEISVQISADRDKAIAALSQQHPELRDRYTAVAQKGAGGHFELIELGRRIGELLATWRSEAETVFAQALTPHATDVQLLGPAKDTELLRGNFLIARTSYEAFEDAITEAVKSAPLLAVDDLETRIIGPTPPGSFVRLDFGIKAEAPLGSAA